MLTARDELRHLADTLTEAEAERVLAAVRAALPELYPDDCDTAARQLVATEPAHSQADPTHLANALRRFKAMTADH